MSAAQRMFEKLVDERILPPLSWSSLTTDEVRAFESAAEEVLGPPELEAEVARLDECLAEVDELAKTTKFVSAEALREIHPALPTGERAMTPIEFAKKLRLPFEVNGKRGDPYQLRIRLTPDADWFRKRLPGAFIHHYFRSDRDKWLHSHPWRWAVCFVLTGGYTDERKEGRTGVPRKFWVRPGSFNFIWKDTFHRLDLHDEARGCWTVCIVAPRPGGKDDETWGFSPPDSTEFESAKARFEREREEEERAAVTT